MHFTPKTSVTLAFLAVSGFALTPATAQNLVTNPGFETGNFTGWTTQPASSGSLFGVTASSPHTGTYKARFGAIHAIDDSISQNLTTIAGEKYSFSFFLAANAGVVNEFHATFGGDTLLEINSTPNFIFPYTEYTFTDVATGPSTVLTFAGRTPSGYFFLDDVSVTDAGPAAVPEASSVVSMGLLLALGLFGAAVARRKCKA